MVDYYAYVLAAVLGCIGGMVRSVIGVEKARARKEKIVPAYLFYTLRISVVMGALAGLAFHFIPLFSFFAGYVFSDVLEGFLRYATYRNIQSRRFERLSEIFDV